MPSLPKTVSTGRALSAGRNSVSEGVCLNLAPRLCEPDVRRSRSPPSPFGHRSVARGLQNKHRPFEMLDEASEWPSQPQPPLGALQPQP